MVLLEPGLVQELEQGRVSEQEKALVPERVLGQDIPPFLWIQKKKGRGNTMIVD